MTIRRAVLPILRLAAAMIPLLEIGCSGSKALPPITSGAYAGPPIGLDSAGDNDTVVVHSPTPGWVPTLDRVADQYKHKAIFITLRKPNPAYFYAQSQVEQRVGTSVLSTEAVKVYARVIAFDQQPGDEPYTFALQSQGTKHE